VFSKIGMVRETIVRVGKPAPAASLMSNGAT
jgi:hypothetical protein